MYFHELRFLAFFALCWAVHWSLPRNGPRKLWLLVCSYVFYAGWDWRFLGLIVASTLIDYTVGRLLGRTARPGARRALLLASLVGNLGILGFFKYWNFFVESGQVFFDGLGLHFNAPMLRVVLPVGISFYTFQTLSYTVDVYRRQLEPVRSLSDFALFVAFFPQLVAGPILRASLFLPQLVVKRRLADAAIRAHMSLFLFGFIKKAVVGDHFAPVIDRVFANADAFGPGAKWLASVLFTVQAYCDFSGYSDMAIASAGLLGFAIPDNFRFPYLARSITDFWRRWHISLTTWFRDYLYIPLGGNRRSPIRIYFNLVLVFLLCGLWHGASWHYVIFGAYHGLFLVVERMLSRMRVGSRVVVPALLGHAYMLFVTNIGLVVFRADDMGTATRYIADMFGVGDRGGGRTLDEGWWLAIVAFAVVHMAMSRGFLHATFRRLPDAVFCIVYGAAVALVIPFAAAEYAPFIYFQF